jgi:hypothetical protein
VIAHYNANSKQNLLTHPDDNTLTGYNVASGYVYDPLSTGYPAELQIRKTGIFTGDLYKKGAEYGKDYTYTGAVSTTNNQISIMRMPTDGYFNHSMKATRTVAYKNLGAGDDTDPGAKKTYTVNLEKLPVPIKITGVFQPQGWPGNRYGDKEISGDNWRTRISNRTNLST